MFRRTWKAEEDQEEATRHLQSHGKQWKVWLIFSVSRDPSDMLKTWRELRNASLDHRPARLERVERVEEKSDECVVHRIAERPLLILLSKPSQLQSHHRSAHTLSM